MKLQFALAILAISATASQAQSSVELVGNTVYAFPHFPKDYENGSESCYQTYKGELVNLNSKSIQEFVFNTAGSSQVWVMDAAAYEGDYIEPNETVLGATNCTMMKLPRGQIEKIDCSTKLLAVCSAPAWMNRSEHMNHRYGFSYVKLRYLDAKKVCEKQGQIYGISGGDLVTIKSAHEEDFLSNELATLRNWSEDAVYYISADNQNSEKTDGYTNFGTTNDSTAGEKKECIQRSNNPNNGSWVMTSCYDYKHFICKWKLYSNNATTATAHITTETTSTTSVMTTIAETEQTTTAAKATTAKSQPQETATTTASACCINGHFYVAIFTVTMIWAVMHVQ